MLRIARGSVAADSTNSSLQAAVRACLCGARPLHRGACGAHAPDTIQPVHLCKAVTHVSGSSSGASRSSKGPDAVATTKPHSTSATSGRWAAAEPDQQQQIHTYQMSSPPAAACSERFQAGLSAVAAAAQRFALAAHSMQCSERHSRRSSDVFRCALPALWDSTVAVWWLVQYSIEPMIVKTHVHRQPQPFARLCQVQNRRCVSHLRQDGVTALASTARAQC